ncbi:FAD-dependent oxidoreductase [Sphingomonas sp.]|uniref:FAD-dependent oxidoreductase n=1 Tax=Sphingomonas sp. TaxID=28214 RepID=UPI002D808685|nr:FAD-dependent oxidoreductase [Sphingomonas sp.]HEU0044250.1 FAD-dependent oxidoreductase [Sphingomonas sp.]
MTPPEGDRIEAQPGKADVLIVGGGAVGLAMAVRLARRGVRVLLLEAGPATPPARYEQFNKGRLVGRPHRGLTQGRMRALGGTTRLWGGQLVPFSAQDFDGPTVDGPSPWPVRHVEIAPAIDTAFRFLGIDAAGAEPDTIWRRASKLPATLGERLRLRLNIWLPQPDFTRLFADDLRSLSSLTIVTDHPVTRLRFAAQGRVAGVEVDRPDGTVAHFAADHVVLATGTFENVKLLLRTAATEPRCGFEGNSNIGKGYIDHLHGLAGTIHVADARRMRELFDNIYFDGRKHGVKVEATEAFRTEHGGANCAGTINTPTSVGVLVQDLRGLLGRIRGNPGDARLLDAGRNAFTLSRILFPLAIRYLWHRRSTSLLSLGVSFGVEIEQIVTSKSYLTLEADVPPERAEICLHWNLDGREIDTVAAFCEEAAAAFVATGLGTIDIDPRITARDPAFLLSCHDSSHQMGGSRMAASAADGVVDRDLRVWGTDNLHVAGACTFPTGSFANPTLTAIAFALRLADHLTAQVRPVGAAT